MNPIKVMTLLVTLWGALAGADVRQEALRLMRDRMTDPAFGIPADKRPVPPASIQLDKLLADLEQFNPDGSYKPDLPVIAESEKDRADSQFARHKSYLNTLKSAAILYGYNRYYPGAVPAEYDRQAACKQLVYRSLSWYFAHRRPPESVYHQTFDYQAYSGTLVGLLEYIGMLLYDDFHADRQTDPAVQALFETMVGYCRHVITDNPQSRGPNWSFRYGNCMRHVLFSNDPAEMDTYMAVNDASLDFDVWAVNGTDGIWPDWSLTHHGDMNYWGMYGTAWLAQTLELGRIVRGTPWEYRPERVRFIETAVVEGLQWILYRGNCEITTAPKRLTYWLDRTDSVAADVVDTLRTLLELYGDRLRDRAAIEFMVENIDPSWQDSDRVYREVQGHRYYWHTEYQVHRRRNYSIAVRRCSQRARGPEDSSNSDIRCHLHFGSGYTSILRRGDEYRLSRLGLDYQSLPGTTCERNGVVNSGKAGSRRRGVNLFSGGVSEGGLGAGAFEMKLGEYDDDSRRWRLINGAGALKGNFFFSHEMVCLGQDVRRIAPGRDEIWTTLNQLQRRSEIVYAIDGGPARTITPDQTVHEAIPVAARAWFWHDRIGYVLWVDRPATVLLMAERRPLHPVLMRDSYKTAISAEDRESGTINMFQLTVNHGVDPDHDTYAYVVIPDVSLEAFERYRAMNACTVVQNSAGIQAVYHSWDRALQAVFFQPGTVRFEGRSVQVDRPAIVMLRRDGDRLRVSLANPVHRGLAPSFMDSGSPTVGQLYDTPVAVTLDGFEVAGAGGEPVTLAMMPPVERGYEGQTVTRELALEPEPVTERTVAAFDFETASGQDSTAKLVAAGWDFSGTAAIVSGPDNYLKCSGQAGGTYPLPGPVASGRLEARLVHDGGRTYSSTRLAVLDSQGRELFVLKPYRQNGVRFTTGEGEVDFGVLDEAITCHHAGEPWLAVLSWSVSPLGRGAVVSLRGVDQSGRVFIEAADRTFMADGVPARIEWKHGRDSDTPFVRLYDMTVIERESAAAAGIMPDTDTLAVSEQGPTRAVYRVALTRSPTAEVRVRLEYDPAQVQVTPQTLVFTPSDWSARPVTVTAVDDRVEASAAGRPASAQEAEAARHVSVIRHRVETECPRYAGYVQGSRQVADVAVVIANNDCDGPYSDVDVNYDCRVDLVDLAAFVSAWLDCTADNGADCG